MDQMFIIYIYLVYYTLIITQLMHTPPVRCRGIDNKKLGQRDMLYTSLHVGPRMFLKISHANIPIHTHTVVVH